jgi:hypothetical protein
MKWLYSLLAFALLSVATQAQAAYTVWAGHGPTTHTNNVWYVQNMSIDPATVMPWGAYVSAVSYEWNANWCWWWPGTGPAPAPSPIYGCWPAPTNGYLSVRLCWYDGTVKRDCVDVTGQKAGWTSFGVGRYFGSFGGAPHATSMKFEFKDNRTGETFEGGWNHIALHY